MLSAGPPLGPRAPCGAPCGALPEAPLGTLSLLSLLAALAACSGVSGLPATLATTSLDLRPLSSTTTSSAATPSIDNDSVGTVGLASSPGAAARSVPTTVGVQYQETTATPRVPSSSRPPSRGGIPAAGAGKPAREVTTSAPEADGHDNGTQSLPRAEHLKQESLSPTALPSSSAWQPTAVADSLSSRISASSQPAADTADKKNAESVLWSTRDSPSTLPSTTSPTVLMTAVVSTTAVPTRILASSTTTQSATTTHATYTTSARLSTTTESTTTTSSTTSSLRTPSSSTKTAATSSTTPPAILSTSTSLAASAVSNSSSPSPTMSLFSLAENLISGFAVMVLQSKVHVDEPGATAQKHDDKATNLLEDLVFKPEPMQFITPNNTVVLAQRGTTAYLPCVIKNIADGLVTWLRRRDHHLLTVARGGYAQDERFQVVHDQHPEDWTMQLKFVTDRDAGRYECQVSTHPPVSIYLHLKVVEARCVIEGPAEKFVRAGSLLRLSCHIDQSTTEPEFMFWYKDGVMVNYDQQQVYKVTVDLANSTTTLVVERATRAQSGNYTCEAGQAKPASNYVHVISGENPAAMQTGGGGIVEQSLWLLALLVVMALG